MLFDSEFLSDFGLLELESVFIEQGVDMTQLAQIEARWIEKHIRFARSNHRHGHALKVRLKLAIRELRRAVLREMRAEMKHEDQRDECGEQEKRVHPCLARFEQVVSDPLYMLSFGFLIFVVFTSLLFLGVGRAD